LMGTDPKDFKKYQNNVKGAKKKSVNIRKKNLKKIYAQDAVKTLKQRWLPHCSGKVDFAQIVFKTGQYENK